MGNRGSSRAKGQRCGPSANDRNVFEKPTVPTIGGCLRTLRVPSDGSPHVLPGFVGQHNLVVHSCDVNPYCERISWSNSSSGVTRPARSSVTTPLLEAAPP